MTSEEKKIMEKWLKENYDYERPQRGEIREGTILQIEEQGMLVDIGLKHDGFVPRSDLAQLEEETISQLKPGQDIETRVIKPTDQEGELILSLYQAQQEEDWKKAQALLEQGEIWEGEVVGYNRGGLLVKFEHLRGFVPNSHLWRPKDRATDGASGSRKAYVGQVLPLKAIEVDRNHDRLVFSERLAQKQLRKQNKERLLNDLEEGQICRGTVRKLLNFGAFVDLGGADGLIHISELAWRRVDHPSEVLQADDEIEVYILCLDHKRKRINLSLKRLQPNPWDSVSERYTVGQLVSGTVTNVVDFGAFVVLEDGLEGLAHISELADPPPENPRTVVQPGDELVLRILSIDPERQRMRLSLKQVSVEEHNNWLNEQLCDQFPKTEPDETEPDETEPDDQRSSEPSTQKIDFAETAFLLAG